VIAPSSLSCTSVAFSELARDLLRMETSLRFQAHGVSMHPLVRDGDVLTVKPLKTNQPNLGDVVLCNTGNNQVVVHRVVQRQKKNGKKEYLVQGDQVSQPDGWIKPEKILGWVSTVERDSRIFNLQQPLAKLLGLSAVIRSRLGWRNKQLPRIGVKFTKRLPFIGDFLK